MQMPITSSSSVPASTESAVPAVAGRSVFEDWRAVALVENARIAALVIVVLAFTMTGASAELSALSFASPPHAAASR